MLFDHSVEEISLQGCSMRCTAQGAGPRDIPEASLEILAKCLA